MLAFKRWLTGEAEEPAPEVAQKDAAPQTSSSWFKRKLSTVSHDKENGVDVPLELVLSMNGSNAVIAAIQGKWATGAGTDISISGQTVTSSTEINNLTIDGEGKSTVISMAGCQILLSASTSQKLTWSDNDCWTRQGDATGTDDRTSQWVGKNVQEKQPPSTLLVISPERPELEGRYILAPPSEFINRNPVWQLKRIRLYTDPLGFWMFATVMKMSQNLGIMSSNVPHKGLYPDAVESWEYFAGKEYGGADGWTTAALTSVTVLDKEPSIPPVSNQSAERPRPVSGALRQSEFIEATEYAMRFRLSLFFAEHDLSVLTNPQFINSFVHRILTSRSNKNSNTTIQSVMAALCKKYKVNQPDEWTAAGSDCTAVSKYILEGFYAEHAPKHSGKVDGLLDGLQMGRFTLQNVLLKLCPAFGGNYENWCSPFPAIFRRGYSSKGLPNPDKDSDDGPEINTPKLSKITITRASKEEPIALDFSDQTMVIDVLPGGLGERNTMHRFIGARLHSINGTRIRTWDDYIESTATATTLVFEFYPKVADDRGHDVKPLLLVDLSEVINHPSVKKPIQKDTKEPDEATTPSPKRRVRIEDSVTMHLEKAEVLHREKIESEQFASLTSYLLPRRAALSVSEVEAFYASYVDARTALWKSSELGKPPPEELLQKLKQTQQALARSTLIADKASTLCKDQVPQGIVDVIYKTKGSLASAVQNAQIGDELEKAFVESEEQYQSLSKEIKATIELVSADPENSELKSKLATLNEQMVEVDQDNAKKYTKLIKAASSHPHLAWRSVLHKKQVKADKKKAKKKKEKKAKKTDSATTSESASPRSEESKEASPKESKDRAVALPFGEEKDAAGKPIHANKEGKKPKQKKQPSPKDDTSSKDSNKRPVALPFGEEKDDAGSPIGSELSSSKKAVSFPFGEGKDDAGSPIGSELSSSKKDISFPFGEEKDVEGKPIHADKGKKPTQKKQPSPKDDKASKESSKRAVAFPFGEEKDDAGSPVGSELSSSKKSVSFPFGEGKDDAGSPNTESSRKKKAASLPFGEETDDKGKPADDVKDTSERLPFGSDKATERSQSQSSSSKRDVQHPY